MNLLGNIIWIIFGGLELALGYFIGGILLCITIVGIPFVVGALLCVTIIGIPFGLQHFKLMAVALTPFGREIVSC